MKSIAIRSLLWRPVLSSSLLRGKERHVSMGRGLGRWDLNFESVPFNGVRVDLGKTPKDVTPADLSEKLRDSIFHCKNNGKRAMWVKVPVDKSYLIPVAFTHGLSITMPMAIMPCCSTGYLRMSSVRYHHMPAIILEFQISYDCEKWRNMARHGTWPAKDVGERLVIKGYFAKDDNEVNVFLYFVELVVSSGEGRTGCGVVLNEDTSEVLVVQDRQKYKMGALRKAIWKFPGGLSEDGEDIGHTAEREVFEETGIKSEFQSVLLFRQQHQMKSTFDKSDIFVVCRMKPITYNIILCDDEIAACQWMAIEELLVHPDTTPLIKLAAKLALYGMKYGYEHFDMTATEMRSWVNPKQTFKLYHKPLTTVESLRIQGLDKDIGSRSAS